MDSRFDALHSGMNTVVHATIMPHVSSSEAAISQASKNRRSVSYIWGNAFTLQLAISKTEFRLSVSLLGSALEVFDHDRAILRDTFSLSRNCTHFQRLQHSPSLREMQRSFERIW
jgi:hypothetical protein